MTKSGAGTQTLTGSSTYTGVTTINGGVLSISTLANGGVASGIGSASNAAANLVLNGGTLQYTGTTASTDRSFSLGTAGGTLDASGTGIQTVGTTLSPAMGFVGTGARTLTLTGTNTSINVFRLTVGDNGGATSLVKNGTGQWSVTGLANTYTGGTVINGGTLRASSAASLGTGAVTINNGTYQAGTSFTDSREVRVGHANSTISPGGGTFELSGNIVNDGANVGGVTKTGSGTLILSGTGNTYSGGTTVSGGTLLLNNASGSAVGTGSVTVGSTSTLGGSGIVSLAANNSVNIGNGTLTVGSGASFAESFTVNTSGTGALSFGSAGKLNLDIWTNALNGADVLVTTGAVNLGTGVTLTLTNAGGLFIGSGSQFNIFDWGTAPVGSFGSIVLPTLAGGLSWDTTNLYTTGIISVTGVPEPSSAALLGLGVAALALRRRRVS